MPRIDAHHHLWRYRAEAYGWIDEDKRSLRRDFLLPELQAELDFAGVDGTVVIQAQQTLEETDWLLQLAHVNSSVWGVVGWLPLADPRCGDLLDSYAGCEPLKGLRHVVQVEEAGFLERPDFNRGVRLLHGRGLVYDLLLSAHQLAEATRFVDRHPEQSFVLDHLGKPAIGAGEIASWDAALRELALRPQVTCKLSGMVTETDWSRWSPAGLQPYLEVALEAFGPDRLMIGTDWPVLTVGCGYAEWWQTVEQWIAPLSLGEQGGILGENAARVYSLRPPPQPADSMLPGSQD